MEKRQCSSRLPGSNFHYGPRPFGDPSLIVRTFPLGFVTFRALHISSHAHSPSLRRAELEMAVSRSTELWTGEERKSERKTALREVNQSFATSFIRTEKPSSADTTPHGPWVLLLNVKAPEPEVRRVKKYPRVSFFPKLLHISSTAARQQPLYWKMVEALQVCFDHADPHSLSTCVPVLKFKRELNHALVYLFICLHFFLSLRTFSHWPQNLFICAACCSRQFWRVSNCARWVTATFTSIFKDVFTLFFGVYSLHSRRLWKIRLLN